MGITPTSPVECLGTRWRVGHQKSSDFWAWAFEQERLDLGIAMLEWGAWHSLATSRLPFKVKCSMIYAAFWYQGQRWPVWSFVAWLFRSDHGRLERDPSSRSSVQWSETTRRHSGPVSDYLVHRAATRSAIAHGCSQLGQARSDPALENLRRRQQSFLSLTRESKGRYQEVPARGAS